MSPQALDSWVQCKTCGRRHRWRTELAGRNVACVCGGDVLYPQEQPQLTSAGAPLRDEAAGEAGVDLGAVFDTLGSEGSDMHAPDAGPIMRKRHKGILGLPLEGELTVFGVASLLGIACTILAIVVGKYFVPYIFTAVVVGPVSWWLFWKRWKLWVKDRTFMQALSQVVSGADEQAGLTPNEKPLAD